MIERENIRVKTLLVEIDCDNEPVKGNFDQEIKGIFKKLSDEISEVALLERPRRIKLTDSRGIKIGKIRVVQTPQPFSE